MQLSIKSGRGHASSQIGTYEGALEDCAPKARPKLLITRAGMEHGSLEGAQLLLRLIREERDSEDSFIKDLLTLEARVEELLERKVQAVPFDRYRKRLRECVPMRKAV